MAKSQFIEKIVQRITVAGCPLTLVSNPDGLLTLDTMRNLLYADYGIELVAGSQLDLRLHFETERREHPERRYVYICQHPESLLPDMKAAGIMLRFNIGDLFPMFQNKTALNRLCQTSPQLLDRLYDRSAGRIVKMAEGEWLIKDIIREADEEYRNSVENFQRRMAVFTTTAWKSDSDTIMELSSLIAEGIEKCYDASLRDALPQVNRHFQTWVDENYFSLQNSSALLSPKCVNKILPYLSSAYTHDDKVALLVVDGLSYWQYAILKRSLVAANLMTDDSTIVSWLPSITMLSRQAIFRGMAPLQDYKQNPTNEAAMWRQYWEEYGLSPHEVQYVYMERDEFAINEGVKRLALVTVEMDEKMHAVSDYGELALLTDYWAQHIIEKIKTVVDMGFTLYLTTDHGSVESQGWRALSPVEKVFLYADGSRGARHLIYKNSEEQHAFYEQTRGDIELLQHDNWLAIRDSHCFAAPYKSMITHGGSHFMEVVIPWIKISK